MPTELKSQLEHRWAQTQAAHIIEKAQHVERYRVRLKVNSEQRDLLEHELHEKGWTLGFLIEGVYRPHVIS